MKAVLAVSTRTNKNYIDLKELRCDWLVLLSPTLFLLVVCSFSSLGKLNLYVQILFDGILKRKFFLVIHSNLQTGHVLCTFSHCFIQSGWYKWLQGSFRAFFESFWMRESLQIGHSSLGLSTVTSGSCSMKLFLVGGGPYVLKYLLVDNFFFGENLTFGS